MLPQPSIEEAACILHRWRKTGDQSVRVYLQFWMLKNGLKVHGSLGNYFVMMLVEDGSIDDARAVFDRLTYHHTWSWDALIGGYVKCEKPQNALTLYEKFQKDECVHPTGHTFVEVLKACKKLKDLERGSKIHADAAEAGWLSRDLFVCSTLVDFYSKCGSLSKAQKVFDEFPVRDVVIWTALIRGYIEHEHGDEALECFEQMQGHGFSPNAVTFVCGLKACGIIGAIEKGQRLHMEIETKGLLEGDVFVGSALVDMYSRCGLVDAAQQVFDKLSAHNVVLWNTLIAGYVEHGFGEEAIKCYDQMQFGRVLPDAVTFLCSLKACGSIGATEKGQEIHAELERKGILESDLGIGNSLVNMYAKSGLLDLAEEVFSKLQLRDVISWTALIEGYAEHGNGKKAIELFNHMQIEDISPNSVTIICCLKACGNMGDVDKGEEIHTIIERLELLESDLVVGNTLIDMYAKCGLLVKAHLVFEMLPKRNIVSWNALMSGYCEHEKGEQAFDCFECMKLEGVLPSAVTYVCSLTACGILSAIDEGMDMHGEIEKRGMLEGDSLMGNSVVDMYAKCGSLSAARKVFDKLRVRDVVAWTTVIAGYAEHGHYQQALGCIKEMQLEGYLPDVVTLVCALKACGNLGDTDMGEDVHAEIERQGMLEKDLLIGSTLVDMYGKCGLLVQAHEVFDRVKVQNVVIWNALIAGYAEHGHGEEALQSFEEMVCEEVSPDALTFIHVLKACASIGALDVAQEIHAEIERQGLVEKDPLLGDSLIDMYAKCGIHAMAREVFGKLSIKSVLSWTALILGYTEQGHGEDALQCFHQMQREGVSPDDLAFVCSLKACSCIGAVDKGEEIHAEIERMGLLEDMVGNTLVDMYGKCGLLAKARQVFDKLPSRNVVSWNALISGYAEHDDGEEAINCFEEMQGDGIQPDGVTLLSGLKACGNTGARSQGRMLHADIERHGLLKTDIFVGSGLVDMYARCDSLERAQHVFDKLPIRDAASWNTLMVAYVQHGHGEEALNCVHRMLLEGVPPSSVTVVCSLKACGSIGATGIAAELHAEIERQGSLESDAVVGSALVDMYAKWGFLTKAQEVFDKLPVRSVIVWTALMAGYALLGESENVFVTYEGMLGEGMKPDPVTFVVILNTCSRMGVYGKTETFFIAMCEEYGILPSIEHHNCMVDSLSRVGHVEQASLLVEDMPACSHFMAWKTMLGACLNWGHLKLARQAFEHTTDVE